MGMFTLRDIFTFISQNNDETLKNYYDKCCDNLKELNKRSNFLSLFIVIIFGFYFFSTSVKKIEIIGFEIEQKIILITAPLLLSYFILEWCLIARRRRELMKTAKHIGIKLFKIDDIFNNYPFPYFGLHSRNIIPFSFLIELFNVEFKSKVNAWLLLVLIVSMWIGIPIFIGYTLYISFTKFPLTWQIIGCNLLSAFCLLQIILFYASEIKAMIFVMKDDAIFLYQLNNPAPNPPQ